MLTCTQFKNLYLIHVVNMQQILGVFSVCIYIYKFIRFIKYFLNLTITTKYFISKNHFYDN